MRALSLASSNDFPIEVHKPLLTIVSTTPSHILELEETIRDDDRKEIESFGISSEKGLWMSFKRGLGNQTALIDGKVAAIWGCCGTYFGDNGQPWLLTSDEVYKVSPLRFAKIYQKEVHKMLELFPSLENYVAVEYEQAIRMLSIVGFNIGEPERYGNGMFRKFVLVKK